VIIERKMAGIDIKEKILLVKQKETAFYYGSVWLTNNGANNRKYNIICPFCSDFATLLDKNALEHYCISRSSSS
jgi:hypothetical protein